MDSALFSQAQRLFGEKLQRRQERAAAKQAAASQAPTEQGTASERRQAPQPVPGFELTAREQSRLWRHVGTQDNFWQSLREIESGAVKRLADIAAAHRWEVIFLTKRPASAGATAQVQSQRWLVSKGFERPSVYVVQGSRGLIAAALDLDVVVDDRLENCCDVIIDSGARAILVWRGKDEQFSAAAERLGIEAVPTVEECLELLSRSSRS